MGETADDRVNYYNDFSDLYGVASSVAHGRKIKLPVDEQRALMQRVRKACRDGIVKCLEEGELTRCEWKNLVVGKKSQRDGVEVIIESMELADTPTDIETYSLILREAGTGRTHRLQTSSQRLRDMLNGVLSDIDRSPRSS